MITHITIMTGASRGMGLAMAQQLLSPNHSLLCISRGISAPLGEMAHCIGADLTQWQADLADASQPAAQLRKWLADRYSVQVEGVTLINNAAVIPAIVPLRAADTHALVQALRVGLEAPMVLTAAFLAATQTWPAARKVLNISSGLGRHAMASQSAYCAAKAGLDHFTRCLAQDEAAQANGAKVCALAPGVVDTDMQLQLRNADPSSFPNQASFVQLKQAHQLTSPHEAAKRVLAYLNRADFGSQPVADVRD